MDLLNNLNKQVAELWQKHIASQNQKERDLLLKQYKETFNRYVKHKEWLKIMDAQ